MNTKSELTLFVEPLEKRLMLSGNVMATLIGDDDLSLEFIDNQTVLVGSNDTTINGSALVVAQL